MNNPYHPGAPVSDCGMFFGREHELREIGAFLNGNQSISIVGPHKIGKTSLMRQVVQAGTARELGIGRENLLVYFDCQALSSRGPDEIFALFCSETAAALQAQGIEQGAALEDAAGRTARAAFEAALRKLSQRGLRVVLMFDDFEQLTLNPQVDLGFYNALRSAAVRLRLVFLTSSRRPLVELTYFDGSNKILSSPFFNIFAQVFLGLLTESEARNMVRAPMEAAGIAASAGLEDFIYQLAGGHPLALQVACFHAWEGSEDLFKIEQQTRQDLEPYFQAVWQELSPVGQEMLHHPAKVGAGEAGNPALRVALRDLTRKCLLVQTGGTYRYISKAWAEFVTAHWR